MSAHPSATLERDAFRNIGIRNVSANASLLASSPGVCHPFNAIFTALGAGINPRGARPTGLRPRTRRVRVKHHH